ncbi:DUF1120 domain-containing protein [Pseudomonas sp. RTS1]|uniref:DUF1120 domain-containing protein n=1 Tax=unclassified Pseudomonas TaxID=196821 RepID=UPI002B22E60B|nr:MULTISPECIES: DUF1120 domain-containing protein [unclassified Pseudomonas]MEA9990587.1 DUF1120 domain-containing protein [Pseudomonas sp. RTS1]MEB0036413.1 DUF1120 domain-containing protein [Pseudomonas sp. RTS2]MEB0235163.1 DUF1120 domain-containing protein [Pseudomonas sp. 5S3]MEB0251934.1 DUF1120 domain-containing protein [Pseudomonas sp. 5S2]
MPLATCMRSLCMWLLLGIAGTAQVLEECQLNVSEAQVDFGLMNRLAQHDGAPERLLGERRLSVNVNCPQAEDLSLFYRALAATPQRLQFTEHGSYAIEVGNAVLDGRAVELGLLTAAGQPPVMSATVLEWRPGHGIAPIEQGAVLMGKTLSLQLTLRAWAGVAAIQARDATTWEVSGMLYGASHGRYRELTLRAHFAPVACLPTLSDHGVVDYGTLYAKDLSATNETPLPTRTLRLNVSCDAPIRFGLRMKDNRDGSATGGTDETAYGLDLDASRNKIGRFYLTIDPGEFSADSFPTLYRTDSTSNGVAWSSSTARQIPMAANSLLGFTDKTGVTTGPVSIQTLTGTMRIKTYLAPMQSLDLRDVVRINGSGTLEIVYL